MLAPLIEPTYNDILRIVNLPTLQHLRRRIVKVGLLKSISKLAGHIVDIRVDRWFNIGGHKDNISYLTKLIGRIFKLPAKDAPQITDPSFEEIVKRDALTPNALNEQSQYYKMFSIVFLAVALLLFVYSLLLLYFQNFMGLCISVALIIYTLSLAFRFHFWHFQILKRNLNCTPQEWAQFVKKGVSDV